MRVSIARQRGFCRKPSNSQYPIPTWASNSRSFAQTWGARCSGLGQLDAAAGKLQAALSGAEVPTRQRRRRQKRAGLALVLLKQE